MQCPHKITEIMIPFPCDFPFLLDYVTIFSCMAIVDSTMILILI